MAKRSGRDRDRDAARKGSRGAVRAGGGNRRLARELGKLGKRLDQARSAEAKRLRQLDEAAAEVVRLEAELRRLQAAIAGAANKAPAPAPPAPVMDVAARAAGLEAELARLESVPRAALPEDLATLDGVEAAEVPGGWPEPGPAGEDAPVIDGEVAEPGIDPEAFLRHEAPVEAGEAAPASPWAEPWAESAEIEAPDEWPEVIHLGAGSRTLESAHGGGVGGATIASAEQAGDGEALRITGAGLPVRPQRHNGAGDPESPSSPETARREAAEAPDPTARSWPQRGRERVGR